MKHTRLKNLLDEATVGSAVGGFVGRRGQDVDDLFAGGFKPDEGELKGLLKKQIVAQKDIRKFTDLITPEMEQEFALLDLEWDKEFDTNSDDDATTKLKFKNLSNKFMAISNEIEYDMIDEDDIDEDIEEDTSDWKYIYKQKQEKENV